MRKISVFYLALFLFSNLHSQTSERLLNTEHWKLAQEGINKTYLASVPGDVHLDLMANKVIPDPYKDLNEGKVQWIEKENWMYSTSFQLTAKEVKNQNIDLIFDGLDTFADITLNGVQIKSTDNMFRTWEIPVKSVLKQGENKLMIRFRSAVKEGEKLAKNIPFTLPETPRSMVRKAQYQFGWDWGPRLVTAGIWKDVKLKFWNKAKIQAVQIEQKDLSENLAKLQFNVHINAANSGSFTFSINHQKYQIQLNKGENNLALPYQIEHPKLWWPNGWGAQNMYHFELSLADEKSILEKTEIHTGLRTIELVQTPDNKGKTFYFKVNGKPMYARGTNWIPSDSFTPRISKEKYRKLIEASKDANFNMIRIWGGGIYEDEEFYKACDENGILVWQDFMFAGSFYPADAAFLENVKQEVKDQVRRLENHPSIALWCGNNEVDEAIVNWGYQKQFKYSKTDSLQVWKDYKKLFHEVIPNTLNEILPKNKNLYWPSSPSIGWGHPESLTQGDSHYWGVWWGEFPFELYNEKVGRFMSEYGFQGMPSIAAFKDMFSGIPELSLDNKIIQAHEKNNRGWDIIRKYMERDYPIPTDFEKYTYVSQLLQARGMQIAIEAHRRNKPYNMGSLYWQLNDCWPVVSWSAIDYLGNYKALQYETKRSFEPVKILGEEKDGSLYFYAVNDGLENYENVQLEVKLQTFNGETLNTKIFAPSNSTLTDILKFEPIKISEFIKNADKKQVFISMILSGNNKKALSSHHFFLAKPKDLRLPKPEIIIKKRSDNSFEVSSNVFVKDLYLKIENGNLSENYFDLLPGESKIISSEKPYEPKEWLTLYDVLN